MTARTQPMRLLMAEDDRQDQFLVKKAFREARCLNNISIVENGEELLAFLRKEGKYASAQRPDLILLDLNMPRKDGREALREIKSDPALRDIPIIVLTTSAEEADVLRSYKLGVTSYIQKPVTFAKLVEVADVVGRYWFEIVKLPPNHG